MRIHSLRCPGPRPSGRHVSCGRPALRGLLGHALLGAAALATAACAGDPRETASGPRAFLVETAEVTTRDVTLSSQAVGTVYASALADVRPQVDGVLFRVDFTEGQQVHEGEILATLDDRKAKARLELVEAQLDSARARLEVADSKRRRGNELVRDELLSTEQFEGLEAEALEAAADVREFEAAVRLAARELEDYYLRAPFDGTVGMHLVDVGNYLEKGTVLTTVLQADPVEVQFAVPSREMPELALGDPVIIDSSAGRELARGTLRFIDPRIDPATRMLTLKALVPNPDGVLKPGLFVSVRLVEEVRAATVVVPEEAIVPYSGKSWVFVVEGTTAHRREVVPGARLPGEVAIDSGLEPGQIIVRSGQHRLSDGAEVEVAQ
jgi:membrane fusion protein (multidrug efflux system)